MDLVVCSASHLVADSLTSVLERAGQSVIGRASRLDQAVALCEMFPVSVCVVDLEGMGDSRPMIDLMATSYPETRLVALVDQPDLATTQWADHPGIDRLLSRSIRSAELVEAVMQSSSRDSRSGQVSRRPRRLSPTEQRVLTGLCMGADTRTISDNLGVAESTVRSHVRAIFDKLGVRSRVAAVLVATSLGLCDATGASPRRRSPTHPL